MSKNSKIVIAVLLVIAVILICVFAVPKKDGEEVINNTQETENVVNEVENKVEENTVVGNKVEEPVIENKTEVPEQGKVYEENSDVGTTDKKQQAIALVKDKWGEDSTVTFRCDSITNDGEYIIAVVSSQTASVKNYFKVNLEAGTVEIDY